MTSLNSRTDRLLRGLAPGRLVLAVFALLLILATALGMLRPAGSVAANSVVWKQYDVSITVNDDGSMTILEDQIVEFSGRFSHGFASIPLSRLEDLENVEVSLGNSASSLEPAEYVRQSRYDQDPGTFTYYTLDGNLELDYGFDPTDSFGTDDRYIQITYDVIGGLRSYPNLQPPNQQVWWIAISDLVTQVAPIENSTVTVTLPETVDPAQLIIEPQDGTISGDTITWTKSGLSKGDDFEVRTQFPILTSAVAPAWQVQDDQLRQEREEKEERQAIAGTFLFAAGLLLFVVGGIVISGLWYVRGRDPHVGLVAEYLAEPPDDLGPGAAGALIDEYVQVRDVVATVVDLINRGVIELVAPGKSDESPPKQSEGTTLHLKSHSESLRPHELKLLEAIFPGKAQTSTLASVQNTFTGFSEQINDAIYQRLVDHKYFSQSPETTRDRWKKVFRLIPVVGIVVAILIVILAGGYSNWIFFPIGTAFILAFLSRSLSNSMPKKTREGAEAAAKWNAFRQYLDDIEKRENLEESTAIFQKYIAYAVAFGLEHAWVEKFTSVDTPVPDWWAPVFVPSTGRSLSDQRRAYPRRTYRRAGMPAGGDWVFGESSGGRGGFDLDLPDLQDTSDKAGRGLQSASSGFFDMLGTAAEAMAESSKSSGGGRRGSFGSSRGGGFSGGGSRGGGGGGGGRGFG
ncbi:MAG: DUF2207 domain-containing protein [Thermomicrobiales bacterium]